ncbi:MAG TPA: hypothetical protein ENH15_01825 [Actinobacteria bacterium]|nr:hypothetical protein [Actinomycetota bacterium]
MLRLRVGFRLGLQLDPAGVIERVLEVGTGGPTGTAVTTNQAMPAIDKRIADSVTSMAVTLDKGLYAPIPVVVHARSTTCSMSTWSPTRTLTDIGYNPDPPLIASGWSQGWRRMWR